MSARASWLRTVALLCAGSFAVHQLRYLLAYGDGAGRVLEHEGHGYLMAVEPLVGLSLASLAAHVVWRVLGGGAATRRHRVGGLVLGSALFAVYAGQETIEGFLAPGHAAGIAGVLGSGGWLALPIAFVTGALLARLLRAVDELVPLVAVRVRRPAPKLSGGFAAVVPGRIAASSPPARHLAGRGPPLPLTLT